MARAPHVVSTHDVERKYGIKNELDDVNSFDRCR